MELTLRDFLNKNSAITVKLPGFAQLFPEFESNIGNIRLIREQQEADKTGIAANKSELRVKLVEKAYNVSKKTMVYAKLNGNILLATEAGYTESQLKTCADSVLRDRAAIVYSKATENIAVLAEYSVTTEELAELKTLLDLFTIAIPGPRLGITEKKQATDQLDELFKANDALLAKFDLLVELVRVDQPQFYSSYKDNRKIIDTGANSLALNALITDKATGDGLKGVKAVFTLANGNNEVVLEKITADKGIFRVKSIDAGVYNVTLSKPGYKSLTVTISVSENELTTLTAQMETE